MNRDWSQPLPPKRITPIGDFLRAWRDQHHISQSKLAEMLGFDHSYVSRVESGTRDLHPSNVPALAEITGAPAEDLVLMVCGYDPAAYRQRIEDQVAGHAQSVLTTALLQAFPAREGEGA